MTTRHHQRYWAAIVVVGGSLACGQFHAQPHPLYPKPVRPSEQTATLSGPVGKVDGLDVSKRGSLFSLLPGCHVVSLRKELGEGGVGGAWSIELPPTVYALRMQAGHSYEIQTLRSSAGGAGSAVSTVGNATSAGGVKIEAVERDAEGKLVGALTPVGSVPESEACGSREGGAATPPKP
jgi:hypothetical protein